LSGCAGLIANFLRRISVSSTEPAQKRGAANGVTFYFSQTWKIALPKNY
jgi:hypothetical protein